MVITGQYCVRGKGGSSKSSSSSGSVREERRHYDKEVTKPSPSSGTSSAQARPGGVAPGSSKHKPSPAKVTRATQLTAATLHIYIAASLRAGARWARLC